MKHLSSVMTVDFVVSEDTSLAVTRLDSDTVSLTVLNGTLLHRQPSAGLNLCIFHVLWLLPESNLSLSCISTYMTNTC